MSICSDGSGRLSEPILSARDQGAAAPTAAAAAAAAPTEVVRTEPAEVVPTEPTQLVLQEPAEVSQILGPLDVSITVPDGNSQIVRPTLPEHEGESGSQAGRFPFLNDAVLAGPCGNRCSSGLARRATFGSW